MPLAGCKYMTRILIAEFVLANSEASRHAARSMLSEAAAMLTAIVTDIAALPNIHVTVLLSSTADASFAASLTNTQVLRGELHPDALPSILHDESRQPPYDAVLLIAPECDGILVSLLKSIQEQPTMPIHSLNLPWRLAELFADKRATDAWLRQHRIATIPTKTIDDTIANMLQSPAASSERQGDTNQLAVLKPRDGAGAGGVQVVSFDRQAFPELPQQNSDDDRWVLQPFLPGVACSVGFIGGGQHRPATNLPPALQNIVTNGGRLSYQGGQIPCQPDIVARIQPIAEQLAAAFGPFDGYVGVDMLVDLSVPTDFEASVRVVEVNPRLCTSYVGYRMLTVDNLATWLLQQNAGNEILWKPDIVHFSTR